MKPRLEWHRLPREGVGEHWNHILKATPKALRKQILERAYDDSHIRTQALDRLSTLTFGSIRLRILYEGKGEEGTWVCEKKGQFEAAFKHAYLGQFVTSDTSEIAEK